MRAANSLKQHSTCATGTGQVQVATTLLRAVAATHAMHSLLSTLMLARR